MDELDDGPDDGIFVFVQDDYKECPDELVNFDEDNNKDDLINFDEDDKKKLVDWSI